MSAPVDFEQRVQQLGIWPDPQGKRRVAVVGFAQTTGLGGTEETWRGILEGRSPIKAFAMDGIVKEPGDRLSEVAAPLPDDYNPHEFLRQMVDLKEARRISFIAAMAVETTVRALGMAGALDSNRRLNSDFDRERSCCAVSSGYGAANRLIGIDTILHEAGKGVHSLNPFTLLHVFPEQLNGDVARLIGFSGWGNNSQEACATGLSSAVEVARLISDGYMDLGVGGGYEELLKAHGQTTMALFSRLGAVSLRNHDPSGASRPYDAERDGFVLGSGGASIVFEEWDHAIQRGAKIHGEVLGFRKSMDGRERTELNPTSVGRTIIRALYNPFSKRYETVDGIMAHATSTPIGDRLEYLALLYALGDKLSELPITAIKSVLGHLAGGAGPVNLVAALQALRDEQMPPINNLEHPDISDPKHPEEVTPTLNYVRNEPLLRDFQRLLVVAYGFGGYNAAMVVGKPYQLAA